MNEHGTPRIAHLVGRRTRILAVTLAAAAILAAACAGSDAGLDQGATPPAPAETPPAPPAPPAASSDAADVMTLPDVEVVDVGSGERLVLSSLAPADRPILAWFWAPH